MLCPLFRLSGGAFSSLPFGAFPSSSFGLGCFPASSVLGAVVLSSVYPFGWWCVLTSFFFWKVLRLSCPSLTRCNSRCSIKSCHQFEKYLGNLFWFSFGGWKAPLPKERGRKRSTNPKVEGEEGTTTQTRRRRKHRQPLLCGGAHPLSLPSLLSPVGCTCRPFRRFWDQLESENLLLNVFVFFFIVFLFLDPF